MITECIDAINAIVRQMRETGKCDARVLAVAAEANQLYYDYLDELLDGVKVCAAVTVRVDGQTIQFKDIEDVASWITSNK